MSPVEAVRHHRSAFLSALNRAMPTSPASSQKSAVHQRPGGANAPPLLGSTQMPRGPLKIRLRSRHKRSDLSSPSKSATPRLTQLVTLAGHSTPQLFAGSQPARFASLTSSLPSEW